MGQFVRGTRDPIQTQILVVVAIWQAGHFLLVHEAEHGQGWYLPAGRFEPGETAPQARIEVAVRLWCFASPRSSSSLTIAGSAKFVPRPADPCCRRRRLAGGGVLEPDSPHMPLPAVHRGTMKP